MLQVSAAHIYLCSSRGLRFELHAEVRKLCCKQLGIDCDSLSNEEIAHRVLGSQHAKDFFIKDDTIRNWRSQYAEADYKRHKNDRMSVEALVWFSYCFSFDLVHASFCFFSCFLHYICESGSHKHPAVRGQEREVQFREDKTKLENERSWMRCEISEDGSDVKIFLATPRMRKAAVRHGHARPMFMDATHGLQRYGFKLATLHVQDEQQKGVSRFVFWSTSFFLVQYLIMQHGPYNSKCGIENWSHASLTCAGQAVAWAILRSESTEAYTAFLQDFKQICEKESGRVFKPSCFIVDNSNAEISGVRYVSLVYLGSPSICELLMLQGMRCCIPPIGQFKRPSVQHDLRRSMVAGVYLEKSSLFSCACSMY
jgi:hypothetical protein